MQWTMPHRVLQIVAGLIGLIAIGAFVMGIAGAPGRSRLPGEKPSGGASTGAAIDAEEATPLSQDRIEGPPPAPELTPEQKAKLDADKKAKAEANAARQADAEAADGAAPPIVTPDNPATPKPAQGDRVGDLLDGVTPAPNDEPPHE
jgi:hypothetical protein